MPWLSLLLRQLDRAIPLCLLTVILKREALKNLMENTGKVAGYASLCFDPFSIEHFTLFFENGVPETLIFREEGRMNAPLRE